MANAGARDRRRPNARAGDRRRPVAGRGAAPTGGATRKAAPAASPRRRWTGPPLTIAIVLAIVAAFIGYREVQAAMHPSMDPAPVSASTLARVAGVPQAVLDAIGPGTATPPGGLPASAPALTRGTVPLVVYAGAEYCPFCAAERWAVVQALSRFGTFRGLQESASSPLDAFPGTPTFTFVAASYQSPHVAFDPVELQSNHPSGFFGVLMGSYATLQHPTALQSHLLETYDTSPYVQTSGAIPFIDIGNRFVVSGSSFDPAILKGLSFEQIARALADPTSPVARAIDGAANLLTAAICRVDGAQPSSVCGASAVTAAAAKLPG